MVIRREGMGMEHSNLMLHMHHHQKQSWGRPPLPLPVPPPSDLLLYPNFYQWVRQTFNLWTLFALLPVTETDETKHFICSAREVNKREFFMYTSGGVFVGNFFSRRNKIMCISVYHVFDAAASRLILSFYFFDVSLPISLPRQTECAGSAYELCYETCLELCQVCIRRARIFWSGRGGPFLYV